MVTVALSSRTLKKNHFEQAAWGQEQVVCGIDEVGRGCLAGPLVTAAVILPPGKTHKLLVDSKELSPQEREKAASWIMQHCRYGIGVVNHRLIDQKNIWQATLIAMKKALVQVLSQESLTVCSVVIDAMPLRLDDTAYRHIPVHYFTKGESKSTSIAAASIIAKVKRDAMMAEYNALFPGYEFDLHKGYATQKHQELLGVFQQSIIHRKSFQLKGTGEHGEQHGQQTICGDY